MDGQQLLGGGAARLRAGRPVGIRASHVQGLAVNNLRALLWSADALRACRERYPVLFPFFHTKLKNTDNLEHGFAIACALNQGKKGEYNRILSSSARADFLEALSNDPERAFSLGRSKRRASMYDEPEFLRERDAAAANDGSSSNPWGVLAMAYLWARRRRSRSRPRLPPMRPCAPTTAAKG